MNYQAILNHIEETIQPEFGKGNIPNYIPSLQNISPHKFGMALHLNDGRTFTVGDADEKFSIQSISKLFTLQLVMRQVGEMIWTRIGKEPSGDPFNSLILLENEKGIPRNPFINAGALVTTDILMSNSKDANLSLIQFLKFITQNQNLTEDYDAALSEFNTAHINFALAHLMKNHNVIHNDINELLKTYSRQCSIMMSCTDLASATLPLAFKGYSSLCKETILSEKTAKRINAVMLTCGTYDSVGSFAYRIGLPAKSGVGGGIVAVVPGKMSIAVWSPELDKYGNSYVGAAALEKFSTLTQCSIF